MAPTDEELISQAVAGNAPAFEQLVFRYDREVLSIASRYTRNADDAKDIYQETFIRVYRSLSRFRRDSEFSTWLYRIATNVCLTYAGKRKLTPVSTESEEGKDREPVSPGRTEDHAEGNEISGRIDHALQQLSPQQRLVFTLRHYQGYKMREIAVMMNCAEGTVKKYLFEATRTMRDALTDLY